MKNSAFIWYCCVMGRLCLHLFGAFEWFLVIFERKSRLRRPQCFKMLCKLAFGQFKQAITMKHHAFTWSCCAFGAPLPPYLWWFWAFFACKQKRLQFHIVLLLKIATFRRFGSRWLLEGAFAPSLPPSFWCFWVVFDDFWEEITVEEAPVLQNAMQICLLAVQTSNNDEK